MTIKTQRTIQNASELWLVLKTLSCCNVANVAVFLEKVKLLLIFCTTGLATFLESQRN